ncbi:MAG: (d)CMP kinase [Candidatus Omnitrophica bacterium]|nr:(d)CMP kinase [Candidatus Omnitrophota bacterium]
MGSKPAKKKKIVIAIDGPAGSGKSTISKIMAKRLKVLYVDTGAMYRALTLKAMREKLDLEDEPALVRLARFAKIDLVEGSSLKVFLDGEDVSDRIRTSEVTGKVKYIARVSGVRKEMVRLQRAIGRKTSAVLEGRDIGTVVFPDADYKFYLDADLKERAKRRHKELIEMGHDSNVNSVKEDIMVRDESDMQRDVGALKQAKDAIFVDTTHLTIDEVVEKMMSYIK